MFDRNKVRLFQDFFWKFVLFYGRRFLRRWYTHPRSSVTFPCPPDSFYILIRSGVFLVNLQKVNNKTPWPKKKQVSLKFCLLFLR